MVRKRGQLLILMTFLISLHTVVFSQMRTVKGRIIDETLAPMLHVSIATRDLRYSTFTDSTGQYSLQVPASCDTVQVGMIGMKTELIPLVATLTRGNRIMFEDNEGILFGDSKKSSTSPLRKVRKLHRQETKRRSALYKKAEKQFNN